ncbi:hypothetical protein GALL_114590 [mine drainage metagenome]|uniref:Uncharacterized protein n=1 Tax=mine drainage metagenome TaxID=410659 RepID=A0A1J5SR70_9ZZZZ
MDLSLEQKQAVAQWVANGDSLSAIQQKMTEQFKVSLTYMDVRFLVDDLNLELKDAKPAANPSDVTQAPAAQEHSAPAGRPEKKGFIEKMKEKVGLGAQEPAGEVASQEESFEEEFAEDAAPAGGGSVTVTVDKVTLIPSALASGTVRFSDGVTGKWIVDQYGRPGFTEISQPGYRPSPEDAQDFMRQLSLALQQNGY